MAFCVMSLWATGHRSSERIPLKFNYFYRTPTCNMLHQFPGSVTAQGAHSIVPNVLHQYLPQCPTFWPHLNISYSLDFVCAFLHASLNSINPYCPVFSSFFSEITGSRALQNQSSIFFSSRGLTEKTYYSAFRYCLCNVPDPAPLPDCKLTGKKQSEAKQTMHGEELFIKQGLCKHRLSCVSQAELCQKLREFIKTVPSRHVCVPSVFFVQIGKRVENEKRPDHHICLTPVSTHVTDRLTRRN